MALHATLTQHLARLDGLGPMSGAELRYIRTSILGITQVELGALVDRTKDYIGRIERDDEEVQPLIARYARFLADTTLRLQSGKPVPSEPELQPAGGYEEHFSNRAGDWDPAAPEPGDEATPEGAPEGDD